MRKFTKTLLGLLLALSFVGCTKVESAGDYGTLKTITADQLVELDTKDELVNWLGSNVFDINDVVGEKVVFDSINKCTDLDKTEKELVYAYYAEEDTRGITLKEAVDKMTEQLYAGREGGIKAFIDENKDYGNLKLGEMTDDELLGALAWIHNSGYTDEEEVLLLDAVGTSTDNNKTINEIINETLSKSNQQVEATQPVQQQEPINDFTKDTSTKPASDFKQDVSERGEYTYYMTGYEAGWNCQLPVNDADDEAYTFVNMYNLAGFPMVPDTKAQLENAKGVYQWEDAFTKQTGQSVETFEFNPSDPFDETVFNKLAEGYVLALQFDYYSMDFTSDYFDYDTSELTMNKTPHDIIITGYVIQNIEADPAPMFLVVCDVFNTEIKLIPYNAFREFFLFDEPHTLKGVKVQR